MATLPGSESTQPVEAPPDGLDIQKGGLESLLLSMLHHWSIQGKEPNVVIDLLQKNFSQDQIYTAHCSLRKGERVTWHKASGKRPAVHAQAESLYHLVMGLNHKNMLPRFTVSSEDLWRVSSMTESLSLRDERSVAARMESLELSMRRVQDTLVSFQHAPAKGGRGGQGGLQGPQVQEKEVQGGGTPSAPKILVNNQEVTSFASVAAKAAALPQQQQQPAGRRRVQAGGQGAGQEVVLTGPGQVNVRGRSPSQKRGNDWLTVGNQNMKKAKKPVRKTDVGTSSVDLSDFGAAAQAGPIQYYIGNTFGSCERETIKTILKKCADSVDKNVKFEVLDVHLLTKEENPRSKCWKVVVPHHCKELMDNPEMFPQGWRHRRFYGRGGGGGGGEGRNDKRQKVTETRSVEEMEQEVQEVRETVLEEQEKERLQSGGQPGVTAGAPPDGAAATA